MWRYEKAIAWHSSFAYFSFVLSLDYAINLVKYKLGLSIIVLCRLGTKTFSKIIRADAINLGNTDYKNSDEICNAVM